MEYSCLAWACQFNQPLFDDIIAREEKYCKLPSYLNDLIKELLDHGCTNIPEKFRGGQIRKIESLIAELESARHFLRMGFEVEFHRDIIQPQGFSSPDILIRKDGIERFVEVTHLKSSDPFIGIIENKCRKFFENHPLRVDIEFRNALSPPSLRREDRTRQSRCIRKSLRQFRDQFERISGEEFPPIIETDDIIFKLHVIDSKKGYLGVILNSFIVDVDFASEYLIHRLKEKATKKPRFPDEYQNTPYIICLVSDEDAIDSLMLQELLYGTLTERRPPTALKPKHQEQIDAKWKRDWIEFVDSYSEKCAYWDDILEAKRRGCSRTLEDNYLIPHDNCFVSEPGLFLADGKMRNVSGVLFIQRGHRKPLFINPFCDIEIFDGALDCI